MSRLAFLVGKFIRLNKPTHLTGEVLYANREYVVLKIPKNSIVYLNSLHIHQFVEERLDTSAVHPENSNPDFIQANTFKALLHLLKGCILSINHGPDAVTGTLVEVTSDYIAINAAEKTIYIFIRHVRTIKIQSCGESTQDKPPLNSDETLSTVETTMDTIGVTKEGCLRNPAGGWGKFLRSIGEHLTLNRKEK